jgi:hypothetical protein
MERGGIAAASFLIGVSPESLKDGVSPESLKDCRLRKGIALKFQAWHQFSDCQGWPQQTSEMQG